MKILKEKLIIEFIILARNCENYGMTDESIYQEVHMSTIASDFENALHEMLKVADKMGFEAVEIASGSLHRKVGGYPSDDHRMPVCCSVMRKLMSGYDRILSEPESGQGATLVIRYTFPRPLDEISR